jgi:hypothetical protein
MKLRLGVVILFSFYSACKPVNKIAATGTELVIVPRSAWMANDARSFQAACTGTNYCTP